MGDGIVRTGKKRVGFALAVVGSLLVGLTPATVARADLSFVTQFGSTGSGAGQLTTPTGVASDPSGNVYVGDTSNHRIDEFSSTGAFIKAYGWGVVNGANAFETCTSSCLAGIPGGGAGQLSYPYGVASDPSGNVYVADLGNQRVDEFSSAGSFTKSYGWGVLDGASAFETCTSSCQGGIGGEGAGQLDYPYGVASDPSGNVYVTDTQFDQIDEFSSSGAFLRVFGNYGSGAGQMVTPTGLGTDPSGNVYVADNMNMRIDEFSSAGVFTKAYGWGVLDGANAFETCTSVCQGGIPGGGAGQFNHPWAVASDPSGNVYVADEYNQRFDEFSSAGAFIASYGWGVLNGAYEFQTCTSICENGIEGGGAGQFNYPRGVASDPSGNVYLPDSQDRIQKFANPAPASLALSPTSATAAVGTTVTLTATSTDAVGNATPGITVRFSVTGSTTTSGTCVTGANGQCSFTYTGPSLPGADAINAYADTNNNNVQDNGEPSASATVAWGLPSSTPGTAQGAGHIPNPAGNPAIGFGFDAKNSSGTLSGTCHVIVISHGLDTQVKCTDVTALVESGNTATVFGDATVNGVATVYRIDVVGNSPSGGSDTFTIQTESGYYASGTLTNGHITVK
jgi:hypothetical protein